MEEMKRSPLKNAAGLSLVELLAAIALLGLVLALIMSVLVTGQKQYAIQYEKTELQDAITLAMKDITKEIRKAETVIAGEGNSKLKTDTHKYKFSNNTILKNDKVLVSSIENFEVEMTEAEICTETADGSVSCTTFPQQAVNIMIESAGAEYRLETRIYLRE